MSAEFDRILIVRLGGIGDVVCTLPALEAIRAGHPKAFIGYAVEERAFDLVHGHPAIDHVHRFPRREIVRDLKNPFRWKHSIEKTRDYIRSLNARHYSTVLDFQRNLKGAIHSRLSGARRSIGFTSPTAREFNHWFHREQVDPGPEPMHWVDKFLAMAKVIGGDPAAARYRLPDAPKSKQTVEHFLQSKNLSRFVVLHPGTSGFDMARRWEPARFGELSTRIKKRAGIPSIVTWGPGERSLAEAVVSSSNGAAILSFESRSLLDLAELYRRAAIYIGGDTGPMHIATAVGLPSVVLFGSGNPEAYGPRSTGSRVVARRSNGRLLPISDLSVEDVLENAVETLTTVSER